jgi:alpha-beta hydrolase superfamily lysophospholipase
MINDIDLTPTCTFLKVPGKAGDLQVRAWGDEKTATATVLLVHGLGAHSAWFEAMARQLASHGFRVFAYDQKGFGSRGNEPLISYKEWIDDLTAVVAELKQICLAGDRPFFLMGNSMGALVVMAAAQQIQVDGIVIYSPGFEGFPGTFTLSYKLKAIFSALCAPLKEVRLPYSMDLVTRDLSVRKYLANDEIKKMAVPGRMLTELLKLSNTVVASLKTVNVPVLMFTAGVEKIVNNAVNVRLFAKLQAPSKDHIHMNEAWHDLMFDPQVDEVASRSASWIQSKIGEIKKTCLSSPET